MKKLWNTIVEQAGVIIGTIGVMSAAVYSIEKNISENKKNQTAINEQIENLRKLVEEQKLELERQRSESAEREKRLDEILNNLDKYQKMAEEAFNNETSEYLTKLANEQKINEVLDNNTLDLLNIKKASLFDLEAFNLNESVNYSFYASFSTAIMLGSYTTLSALMGLITNYYTKLYGDQYVDKAPKWLLPIIKNYFKLVEHSNTYYYIIIFISQVLIMLSCIYMKFRGIA